MDILDGPFGFLASIATLVLALLVFGAWHRSDERDREAEGLDANGYLTGLSLLPELIVAFVRLIAHGIRAAVLLVCRVLGGD